MSQVDIFNRMRWAFSRTGVTPAAKVVLAYLAYRDGVRVFPSQKRIAKDTGLDIRTVERAVLALEAAGLIERQARYREDSEGRMSDEYFLDYADEPSRQAAGRAPGELPVTRRQDTGVAPGSIPVSSRRDAGRTRKEQEDEQGDIKNKEQEAAEDDATSGPERAPGAQGAGSAGQLTSVGGESVLRTDGDRSLDEARSKANALVADAFAPDLSDRPDDPTEWVEWTEGQLSLGAGLVDPGGRLAQSVRLLHESNTVDFPTPEDAVRHLRLLNPHRPVSPSQSQLDAMSATFRSVAVGEARRRAR